MSNPTPTTFAGIIRDWTCREPNRPALTVEGGDRRPDESRSYGSLWTRGQELAQGLVSLGLERGEFFGILMANHVEFVDIMVAAGITGTVFVPIDPRAGGDKLVHMLGTARCVGVIAADYAIPNLEQVRDRLPDLRWVLSLATDEGPGPQIGTTRTHSYSEVARPVARDIPMADVSPDEAMQVIYTSGTTGDAKGIVMTHRRYCGTSAAAFDLFYDIDDRPYTGLSLTHANAQIVTLGAALTAGLPVVMSRRFTKSRLWDITRKYDCTTFTLLGGMTAAVYADPPDPRDGDNPVRFVVSAGMPAAIWEAFEERFDLKVLEFYGAAEGGLCANPCGVGPIGSIGRPPASLQYRIVDEDGLDVPLGGCGELLMRAADGTPFRVEYLADPEASAAKCRDGWLHMGDVVRQDADGWLYFEYRKGGGLRHNGEFINTASVEKVIAESGSVADVYVYGVPAASGAPGEKDVIAAVVPAHPAGFDPRTLIGLCRRHLDANSVPTYIQVLDQIPKTASEKPQDRYLLAAFHERPEEVFTGWAA